MQTYTVYLSHALFLFVSAFFHVHIRHIIARTGTSSRAEEALALHSQARVAKAAFPGSREQGAASVVEMVDKLENRPYVVVLCGM